MCLIQNKKGFNPFLFASGFYAEICLVQLIFSVQRAVNTDAPVFFIDAAALLVGTEHGFRMDLVFHVTGDEYNISRNGLYLACEIVAGTLSAKTFKQVFLCPRDCSHTNTFLYIYH